MLFAVSYGIYEFKFNVLVFLIMASIPKFVLASEATIRDNMVRQDTHQFHNKFSLFYKFQNEANFTAKIRR